MIKDLLKSICERIDKGGDFEFMVGDLQELITNTGVRLSDKEIKEISTYYFNKQKTQEGLRKADMIYQELDHANNQVI